MTRDIVFQLMTEHLEERLSNTNIVWRKQINPNTPMVIIIKHNRVLEEDVCSLIYRPEFSYIEIKSYLYPHMENKIRVNDNYIVKINILIKLILSLEHCGNIKLGDGNLSIQ